ncbi:GNAT family N-acetyltransferase [Bordetella genomosp. 1]|uniref:GNAT family N-acetyltransferase n=1 Tax=Bordetella genomosp. 1 TaxID=1395607 RepID=A0A261SPC2_9BORD|nr:GNAT family N-acetyltransferase [Bordetella genomosp. 1]OZI38931.1 GNAT family N-acetyltransferase [Bordetella genomosp. 1]
MVTITEADFHNPAHGAAIVALLDEYATDPMGGGAPISAHVRANLIGELARRPNAHALIAWDATGAPCGLAISFEGFSTFACQPLLNLHDFMVSSRARGQGVALKLLDALEGLARRLGCCKITLEVLEGNEPARKLYLKAGYADYALGGDTGAAQFWQKKLAA